MQNALRIIQVGIRIEVVRMGIISDAVRHSHT